MMKAISRLFVPAGLLLLVFSCMEGQNPPSDVAIKGKNNTDPSSFEREKPKQSDPVKQRECSKKSQSSSCEEDRNCKEICDDIFSSRADKRKCYELPEGLVQSFEDLLEATEDGDTDEIDPEILECMLDIDEREFAKAVKKMSRGEATDFLVAVADDDALAKVLEEEDDEFNVLKQLLYKSSGSNNLTSQLKKEIEDGKSFFHLTAESSESAWDWLDSYVDDVCEKTSSSDVCPGGESIGAYCTALLDFKERDLKDFLSDTDLFAEEYQEEVEDDNYLYEVEDKPASHYLGDFRDWCANNSPCPPDGDTPLANQKLAVIEFQAENTKRAFTVVGGYCYTDGQTHLDSAGRGKATPKQNILLHLSDYENGEMILNNEYLNYNRENTYYLYIDSNRYELDHSHKGNNYDDGCSGSPYHENELFLWNMFRTGNYNTTKKYNVWLAHEVDKKCVYYTPRTRAR